MGSREGRRRVGSVLLATNVIVSALALGSIYTWTLALVAASAALSTALLWVRAPAVLLRPAASALLLAGGLLLAWTLLQLLPLPRVLVAILSPEAALTWSRALRPLHEPGPGWVTLSLDPTATRVHVLRGLTYWLTFAGALRIAHRVSRIAFLEWLLVVSSSVMAAAALAHPALGAERVFGIYQPAEAYSYAPRQIAPLLNSNHLAAYTNIGLLVGLGLVVRPRERASRPLALALVALLTATNIWASSRGGTAAMVLGELLVIAFAIALRRGSRTKKGTELGAVAAIVAGLAVVFVAIEDEARDALVDKDLSKLTLFRNVLSLWARYPVFGIGRGAFESVFPSVRTGREYWVQTHPENVILQWTAEWGLPVSLAAMCLMLWALRPASMLARSRPAVGAWAALVCVGLHNLVDFSSEIPGVVMALCVCAALVTGGERSSLSETGQSTTTMRWRMPVGRLVVAGVAACGLSILSCVVSIPQELYEEKRTFQALGVNESVTPNDFRARVRGAMLRHPAEAYFPFVGALRASAERSGNEVAWSAAALERSPVHGRAHLLVARALYARHKSQARLEYRLAAEQDSTLGLVVAQEASHLIDEYDDALGLIPEGPAASAVREVISTQIDHRLPATSSRLDAAIVVKDPSAIEPMRRRAAAALHDLVDDEPWCAHSKECLDIGLDLAKQLQDALPGACEGYRVAATMSVAAGQVNAGLAELEGAMERTADSRTCARALAELALATGQIARADAAIDRLTRLGCMSEGECADNLTTAASYAAQRGHSRSALVLYKRAAERAPERSDLLVTVANLARAQGLHGEALDAFSKLAAATPDRDQALHAPPGASAQQDWREEAEKERAAIQQARDPRPSP